MITYCWNCQKPNLSFIADCFWCGAVNKVEPVEDVPMDTGCGC